MTNQYLLETDVLITIKGLEIRVETVDELAAIISRFGRKEEQRKGCGRQPTRSLSLEEFLADGKWRDAEQIAAGLGIPKEHVGGTMNTRRAKNRVERRKNENGRMEYHLRNGKR